MDKPDRKIQSRTRHQIEEEILAASVILEMRTVVEEGNAEYARGYLDGMELALEWHSANWESFKRNHPEIVDRSKKSS